MEIVIKEIARLALRDADFFDLVAEELDLTDKELLKIRDSLEEEMGE
jgi:hypothetical protein